MFVEYRIFTDSRLSVLLNVICVWKGRLHVGYELAADSRIRLLINFWIYETAFAVEIYTNLQAVNWHGYGMKWS